MFEGRLQAIKLNFERAEKVIKKTDMWKPEYRAIPQLLLDAQYLFHENETLKDIIDDLQRGIHRRLEDGNRRLARLSE